MQLEHNAHAPKSPVLAVASQRMPEAVEIVMESELEQGHAKEAMSRLHEMAALARDSLGKARAFRKMPMVALDPLGRDEDSAAQLHLLASNASMYTASLLTAQGESDDADDVELAIAHGSLAITCFLENSPDSVEGAMHYCRLQERAVKKACEHVRALVSRAEQVLDKHNRKPAPTASQAVGTVKEKSHHQHAPLRAMPTGRGTGK